MSAIRIASNCTNCSELSNTSVCGIHHVAVSEKYTCESFNLRKSMDFQRQCNNCFHQGKSSCVYPGKQTAGMLCDHWSPTLN